MRLPRPLTCDQNVLWGGRKKKEAFAFEFPPSLKRSDLIDNRQRQGQLDLALSPSGWRFLTCWSQQQEQHKNSNSTAVLYVTHTPSLSYSIPPARLKLSSSLCRLLVPRFFLLLLWIQQRILNFHSYIFTPGLCGAGGSRRWQLTTLVIAWRRSR